MDGIIVEGKNDVAKIQAAIGNNFEFIVLGGIRFKSEEKIAIKEALRKCDRVFALTDPDEAGERVAKRILSEFPEVERIKINGEKARILSKRGYKYGVEYCGYQYLKKIFIEAGLIAR